jgi:hypothetical protein
MQVRRAMGAFRSRVPVFVIFAVSLASLAAISLATGAAAAAPVPGPLNSPAPTGSPSASPASTLAVPTITLNPVNSVLSFDNQHPVVSGTVTEVEPGGTTPVPYAGQQVILVDSVLGNVSATTDTSGAFSFPAYTNPGAGETFSVQVPASSSTAEAQTTPVSFSLKTDQVRLAAALSATKICYCGKASVSGTVSYAPGATYKPLAGQPVQVLADGHQVAAAVTDDSGHFAVTLPREAASLTWTVRAGGGPYLSTATAALPMTVELPTVVSSFQLALNQFWQVGFHGCLSLTHGTPGDIESFAGLVIQYSAGRNGPWHPLGAVPNRLGAACGNGGRAFGGMLNARLNYSYYRVVYSGAADRSGTWYLPATSGKVLSWKYADRVAGFTVSSHRVHKGGKLTVTGRLQYYATGWRNFGRQPVQVILRPSGSKNWYWIARVTTNSSGYFSVTFTDPVSATWAVEYLGNKMHLATVSPMTFVRVTG